MRYSHTQRAPAFFQFGVIALLVLTAGITVVADGAVGAVVGLMLVVIALLVLVFSRLTVEVNDDGLQASFGRGWPRRTARFDESATARVVRNRWWYGFGIRWIPGGILWNVWGLDAVELDLTDGKKLRIGTDEPDALLAALVGRVAIG